MILSEELCIGCGECVVVCPGGAISVGADVACIDRDLCFECCVCHRWDGCPTHAFEPETSLPWPRSLRRLFSDPLALFEGTSVSGRGTEEMKTDDVSDRFAGDVLGISVDVGRPNVGTRFDEVERICAVLAEAGLRFAPDNPVTELMDDVRRGTLPEEIRDERVLSAVIEGLTDLWGLPPVLSALEKVAGNVDTVFSVGLIARTPGPDGIERLKSIARGAGGCPRPSAKINLGLGKKSHGSSDCP